MYKSLTVISVIICITTCSPDKHVNESPFEGKSPQESPLPFRPELTPEGMIIHGGSFSPDLNTYLYTLSDAGYNRFDTYIIKKEEGGWTEPEKAFFNSDFNEHGAKYSPDGKTIYFTSTRPTGIEGMPDTWHIWRTEKTADSWSAPVFVDIPNLRDKSVSHPAITASGRLYFHVSNPDYSEMTLYSAQQNGSGFREAQKLSVTQNSLACTPYISADGQTLIYAEISNQLNLVISKKNSEGNWSQPVLLNKEINTHGQGNPYLTSDGEYLFYTTGTAPTAGKTPDWQVNWVNLSLVLPKENKKE